MATKAGQFANQIENKLADIAAIQATRAKITNTDGEPLAIIADDGDLVLQDTKIKKKDALALANFIIDQFSQLP
jgi:hypothetical protein